MMRKFVLIGIAALLFGCTNNASKGAESSESAGGVVISDSLIEAVSDSVRKSGSTILGLDSMLILVDDKETSAEDFKAIDVKAIESFTVLKDKASAEVFGEKGKNGVIVVKMKK